MKTICGLILLLISVPVLAQGGQLDGFWVFSYLELGTQEPEFNPYYLRNAIELEFTDDGTSGTYSGHDMCHRTWGKYILSEKKGVKFSDMQASDNECIIKEWPSDFWKMMTSVSSYAIFGNELMLKFNDGRNLLIFMKKEENK